MVARDSVAVALRAKDGINFLLQTRGLDAKVVGDALKQAAHLLTRHAEHGGRGDEDWTGDTAPAFTFDEITPRSSRMRVVFRRVHLVWVLVVIPASSSMLAALQVLEQATRVCVAAARSLEVTPEKLTKKFPEVYLALALVLASSGGEPTRLFAEAELEAAAMAGSDANKGLAAKAAASVANKGSKLTNILPFSGSSGTGKTGMKTSGPSTADDSVSAAQAAVVGRKLADETEVHALGGFELPADALVPAPVADASSPTQSKLAGLEGTGLEHLAGGQASPGSGLSPTAALASPSLAGTGLETLISPPTVHPDSPWGAQISWSNSAPLDPRLFGGMTPPPYLAQKDTGQQWASLPQPPSTSAAPSTPPPPAAGAAAPSSRSPSPLPWEKLPAASPRDAKAIARGRGLLLVELWRANFLGDRLVRAGLRGEVVGAGKLTGRSQARALYRLAAPPDSAATVSASLRAAALDTSLGERGASAGSFLAHLGAVCRQQAVFLRYRLPAIACQPPVLLGLTVTLGLGPGHTEPGALLVVQYAISPVLSGALRSATLDLDCPPGLGTPSQVTPHASWSSQQHRLRWRLEALEPSNTGVLCASFAELNLPQEPQQSPGTPKTPVSSPQGQTGPGRATLLSSGLASWRPALARTAADVRAALCFVGPADATLSGIRLSSGADTDRLTPLVGARCAFHGEVTARPVPLSATESA